MYVITCPIESDKPFLDLADKRFALINRCHNILVKHCIALTDLIVTRTTKASFLNIKQRRPKRRN